MCIYDRYLALCNSINKSPTAVAQEAGISKSLPTKWKNNPDAVPNGTVLKKIAKYFDVPIDFIYSENEEYAKALEKDPIHGIVQFRPKLDDIPEEPNAPDHEVTTRYYKLNDQGQLMALDYMDFLATRYPAFPEEKEKVIDLGTIRRYLHAPAAGYSAPVFDEDYIDMPRTADMPKGADYCLNIRGDSMEPYIHDGQLVYVQRTTALEDGDVGIFFWHGDTYCKQVACDPFGNTYLLSANTKRQDANITVLAADADQLKCLGKVLLPKRLPMPHYD